MRQRFPGFGFLLSVSATLALSGCYRAGNSKTAAPSGLAVAEAAPAMASPAPPPPPADAAPSAAVGETPREMAGMPGAAESPTTATGSATQAAEPSREMLDIEGSVSLQVPKVKMALRALRELTKRAGGVITEERVESTSDYGNAQVTLRVPSGKAMSASRSAVCSHRAWRRKTSARSSSTQSCDFRAWK